MPTLIANYQKQVWVNQLKKSVSMLEQGFQKILADAEVEHFIDIPQVYQESGCCEAGDSSLGCQDLFVLLSKYFKLNYENFDKGDNQTINFSDGSAITHFEFHVGDEYTNLTIEKCKDAKALGGTMCSQFIPALEIDVNGKKGPNISGKDRFLFTMSGEGKLYPNGGKDAALFIDQSTLENNKHYWKNKNNKCGQSSLERWENNCAARIIENGWEMDY